MLEIKDIVNVVINRETTSKTTRDLQTIAILSSHDVFGLDEVYREYSSTTDMLEDGFYTTDFAYIAAQRIFSQNPQVASIIVANTSQDLLPVALAVGDGGATPMDFLEEENGYVADIVRLQAATNDWFFLITDAYLPEDIEAIAEYIETQDAFYVWSSSDHDALDPQPEALDIFSTLQQKGLVQNVGLFTLDPDVVAPEAAWVGRFASAVIGSNTWIHKSLSTLIPESFTRTEMSVLKNKNAHFYTLVGQDASIEGNANSAGGEKIHVVLGAIWLKVRMAERIWNVLYTKSRMNYTNASIEIFKAEIVNVLNEAVGYNILTDDDGFTITVPDANKLTSQERASGYLRKITFRARLAGAILFVDAIEGTVYA